MNADYNEADTCRLYVTPKLRDAGWEEEPYSITEQRTFTDGRIVVTNGKSKRGKASGPAMFCAIVVTSRLR